MAGVVGPAGLPQVGRHEAVGEGGVPVLESSVTVDSSRGKSVQLYQEIAKERKQKDLDFRGVRCLVSRLWLSSQPCLVV